MSVPRLDLLGTCLLHGSQGSVPLGSHRHVQALVYVVMQRQWVPRERLAALFWPQRDRAAALRNLRKVVHLTNSMAGPIPLEARSDAVRCLLATDVDEFEAALAAGRRDEAIERYGGEFAPGLEGDAEEPYAEWLRAERTRLANQWRAAVLAAAGEAASADRVLEWLQRLLAADALDEDALALLLVALSDRGREAEAQQRYRAYADRVAEELGVEPSARLRALAAEAAVRPAAAARAAADVDVFVGRRLELQRIAELLADGSRRALVLHGPGGVGKSRLAREALAAAAQRFADGAHWVALEDLGSAEQVPARITQAVGLAYRDSADAVATLAQTLGERHLLLVLDNAEHLPELGGQLARLLQHCRRLHVLVTSRVRPSALHAEVLALDGLRVPDEESLDADVAGAFDAVRLFLERGRIHQPSFALGDHLAAVNRIVRSVQGLPLAIEMAAAWARLLPPEEIARELQDSIDLLERDPATGMPARSEHTSIRATLKRSWALLAPKERAALAALAVFRGGFTREAAQAVAGASLPLLAALVDKSLVQADRASGRFDLHPLVAAFAWEQGSEPDRGRARRAHVDYYATWLQRAGITSRSDAGGFQRRVDVEAENCRTAWSQAVKLRASSRLAMMGGALSAYLENAGRYAEGLSLISQALEIGEHSADDRQALSVAYRALVNIEYRSGAYESVERHARQGIRIARLAGDSLSLKGCLNALGLSLWMRDRFAQALTYFEAALEQARRDRDRYGEAIFSSNIALLAQAAGDFDKSLRLAQQALAINRELGHARSVATNLKNIGNHHRILGEWEEAIRYYDEGLAVAERHGIAGVRAAFLVDLGLLNVERGALDEAERRLRQALALQDQGAEAYLLVAARQGMAKLHAKRGDPDGALGWLSSSIRESRAQGVTHHRLTAAVVLAELRAAAGDVPAAFSLLAGVLQVQHVDATIHLGAQRLLDRLRAEAGTGARVPAVPIDPFAALDELMSAYLPLVSPAAESMR